MQERTQDLAPHTLNVTIGTVALILYTVGYRKAKNLLYPYLTDYAHWYVHTVCH
jgi:hypothetical protein